MRKILIAVLMLVVIGLNLDKAYAASPIKNYYGYTLLNKDIEDIIPKIENAIANEKEIIKLKDTQNTYFATYGESHFYLKFYPADTNTNLYIVSDEQYDKDKNDITVFFNEHNIKYKKLEDKTALKEYKFDFIEYARTGNLDGLFILPDFIKPLKTGMGKLNDKISSKSKKTSAIPYSVDNDPINLDRINTETYTNNDAQITIVVNEYRLKNKENKYAHAFEYILTNKADSEITINRVTSERLASMKDITSQTFVDLDRLDLIDTVGSFPPVVVATAGTSLLCSVPNWVRLAKVTKESVRFAHSLPENHTIKANGKMRILVLKFKNDPKPLDFDATRNGENFKFSF